MMRNYHRFLSGLYILSLAALAMFAVHGLRTAKAVSSQKELTAVVILDAGHGGPDGGATAADGTEESRINLELALRTDAVFGLLGRKTVLTRETDTDLSDSAADTIAAKKISDIRNRVALVNAEPEGYLVSIHQNIYTSPEVSGAQVFYRQDPDSQALAERMQEAFGSVPCLDHHRSARRVSEDVYLLGHIRQPGILIECGFLSNPTEAERLKTADYQKKLALVIAVTTDGYLSEKGSGV